MIKGILKTINHSISRTYTQFTDNLRVTDTSLHITTLTSHVHKFSYNNDVF